METFFGEIICVVTEKFVFARRDKKKQSGTIFEFSEYRNSYGRKKSRFVQKNNLPRVRSIQMKPRIEV